VPIGLETVNYKENCLSKGKKKLKFIAFTDGKYPYCKGGLGKASNKTRVFG